MRFSIKWLLAATAYAAVVCASAVYAGPWWNRVLTLLLTSAFVFAALGALIWRGRSQAFCAGVTVVFLVAQVAFQRDLEAEIESAKPPFVENPRWVKVTRLTELV